MKTTFTTITLALVLTFGATFANAGIIVSDRAENPCKSGIIVSDSPGIIVSDFFGFITGIIVSDKPAESNCKSGIIVSDGPGIIVSDRAGILVSD
ncbi:MAG: hypothetical protein ACKVQJ_10750 [Pyrinomonadaceae bacterium]